MPVPGRGGLDLALRSLALPAVFGLRWLGQRGRPVVAGVPSPALDAALAMKILADEVFLATEIVGGSFISAAASRRVAREIACAAALYEERGWLRDPQSYHRTPGPPEKVATRPERRWGIDFEHVEFQSGWAPHPGEPGRARWLSYAPNRRAHARILRHPGPPRPWLVCTPGYRMGHAHVDFWGFNVPWLHQDLGLNVAIPVLPFHGPRRVGRRGGDGFLSGDLLDTVHAQAQAVWDVRRLIAWLRREGTPVGVYGLSLGGYTAGLVASLADPLDCVIAGIPASDWVGLVHAHAPRALVRAVERVGFSWADVEGILRVVSPLAIPPRVALERRYLFAGTADRLAPPEQAQRLWHHWERPRLEWYHGTHVSFWFEPKVKSFVRDALRESAFLAQPSPARRAAPSRIPA